MTDLEKAARALLNAEFSSDPEVWSKALEALGAALEVEKGWETADVRFLIQAPLADKLPYEWRLQKRPLSKGPEEEEEGWGTLSPLFHTGRKWWATEIDKLNALIAELQVRRDEWESEAMKARTRIRELEHQLAEARAALEAERWVPCSERMPPLQETVLVAVGGKLWMSHLTSHRFLLARKEKWSGAISDRSITHWRPLPKGPEGER